MSTSVILRDALVFYIKEAWKTPKFDLSDVLGSRNRSRNGRAKSTVPVPTRRLSNSSFSSGMLNPPKSNRAEMASRDGDVIPKD
jgi:hypothetical protein